jgi:hypothetical protein
MSELAKKLQLRPGQKISISGPAPELDLAAERAVVTAADAALIFVGDRAELEQRLPVLAEVAGRDGTAWVAYPKARQLGTDLNRDIIAGLVPTAGLDTVRQVSIDDTWSALRLKAVR